MTTALVAGGSGAVNSVPPIHLESEAARNPTTEAHVIATLRQWLATRGLEPDIVSAPIDGQWFVDEPTTRHWLRQLTDKYLLDTLSPPVANGNTVAWPMPRVLGPPRDAWGSWFANNHLRARSGAGWPVAHARGEQTAP